MVPWIWFSPDAQYWAWSLAIFIVSITVEIIILIILIAAKRIDLFESSIAGVMDGEVYIDSTLKYIAGMFLATIIVSLGWPICLPIVSLIGLFCVYMEVYSRRRLA